MGADTDILFVFTCLYATHIFTSYIAAPHIFFMKTPYGSVQSVIIPAMQTFGVQLVMSFLFPRNDVVYPIMIITFVGEYHLCWLQRKVASYVISRHKESKVLQDSARRTLGIFVLANFALYLYITYYIASY